MKLIFNLFIAMTFFTMSDAQTVIDTFRCATYKEGHLRSLIKEFKVGCMADSNRYSYQDGAFSASGTILFLNQALRTNLFSRYCFLERSVTKIISSKDSNHYILAMAEVGFRSTKDLDRAVALLRSWHSDYFLLEVSTPFVALKKDSRLIIIYSEIVSSNNALIDCFFNTLKNKEKQIIKTKS